MTLVAAEKITGHSFGQWRRRGARQSLSRREVASVCFVLFGGLVAVASMQ